MLKVCDPDPELEKLKNPLLPIVILDRFDVLLVDELTSFLGVLFKLLAVLVSPLPLFGVVTPLAPLNCVQANVSFE